MMNIGWASDSIVSDRPVYLAGQFYTRVSKYVHDPVTATALVIENGGEQATIVSCDLAKTTETLVSEVRARVSGVPGLDPAKISISAIHTHTNCIFDRGGHLLLHMDLLGPGVVPEDAPPSDIFDGAEAADFLAERLASIVRRAWEARRPGGVSRAQDYAAVGFNRRPQFLRPDGRRESVMYGNCDDPTFVRFEGPVDHTINMLYTWDAERNLTGVAVGVPCPSQVMELHYFVSADYWHYARKAIRAKLGNISVLPLCEAAGDQNPLDLVQLGKRNHEELLTWSRQVGEAWVNLDPGRECEKIGRRVADAVVRGLNDDMESCVLYDPVFRHRAEKVSLPLRKVTRADYDSAMEVVAAVRKRADSGKKFAMEEIVPLFGPAGAIERWREQQSSGFYTYEAHFIRIGDTVVTTSAFELFVDYSMRIRARAKAPQIFNVQLANAAGGYLPTEDAVRGGSYSSAPASTKCGPEGGNLLVERYIKEINDLMA